MKRLLPLFFCLPALLQTQRTAAQDSTSKTAVVISPALFVPVSVAVQAGLQFRVAARWQLLVEGAYPTFYPKNTAYERIRYWRAGTELRFLYRRKPDLSRYAAVQVAYLFREFVDNDQAYYYTPAQTYLYTNATIKSPVLSTAVKLGAEIPAGKRFFVDVFTGAGVRFVLTEYVTKSPLVTSIRPKRQTLVSYDDAWLYNYTLKRLHVVAGLRLGVRL